ncbi:PH domain-containing protein [Actinoplanes sp. NPDC005259]|uniref:PH domain-containing protein n=1 Tax=Actinoplanes sp. NPDC005259 TaxID=3154674 RepID=UPI0033AC970A
MRNVSRKPVLRVRKSGALIVAALIALVGTLPFAGARWQLAPILLIPLAVLVWAVRAGTDVDAEGLRVRALFGTTDIPWSRVAELAPDDRRRVSALLTDGKVIRLTGVTSANLPAVIAAGGQRLDGADGSVAVDHPVDERLSGGEPA